MVFPSGCPPVEMLNMKVVVVDDVRIVTGTITKILETENFEVEVAAAGRQRVKPALQKEGALVLADRRMSDIDWIEKHVGRLFALRRKWLESRRGADIR
jgi:CheY-like chemotaxis protein